MTLTKIKRKINGNVCICRSDPLTEALLITKVAASKIDQHDAFFSYKLASLKFNSFAKKVGGGERNALYCCCFWMTIKSLRSH